MKLKTIMNKFHLKNFIKKKLYIIINNYLFIFIKNNI